MRLIKFIASVATAIIGFLFFVLMVAMFFVGAMMIVGACFFETSNPTLMEVGKHATQLIVGAAIALIPMSALAKSTLH